MINSNPLKFFKDLKKPVTNYLVEQADKFPVNNKVLGNYLRAFHLAAPVNMMLLALYIPKNLFIILYILLCGAFFCFVMWDGCFITRVEKILIGDNITFIDPCLEIISMPLTSKNRMNASVLAAFSYMITLSFIFIFRFVLNFSIKLSTTE